MSEGGISPLLFFGRSTWELPVWMKGAAKNDDNDEGHGDRQRPLLAAGHAFLYA